MQHTPQKQGRSAVVSITPQGKFYRKLKNASNTNENIHVYGEKLGE